MAPLRIGPIDDTCVCRAFSCGKGDIDAWFRDKALRRHRTYIVRTFTAHPPGNRHPVGFYSLTLGTEEWKKLKRRPQGVSFEGSSFPAISIHYFAVHREVQRQGIGSLLMAHALEQAAAVAQMVGLYAVTLVAYDRAAVEFYEKLGFGAYAESRGYTQMILPIADILEAEEA